MVTYGFYNSVDHDRTYDATQVSELFDGLINPGVYNSIGQRFKVTAVSNSFQVTVGTGRAWFNHTWTKNDAPLVLNLPAPPTMADRYRSDAIVIDINSDIKVRENKITYVCGEESANSNPPHPTLASGTHTQIPLAYIRRGAENAVETSIDPTQVNYVVGTVPECPWVVGVLQSVDISVYVGQWETAWNTWFADKQHAVDNAIADVNANKAAFKAYVTEQMSELAIWMSDKRDDFDTWFATIRNILDSNAAGHLQLEIEALSERITPIEYGGTGNDHGHIQSGAMIGNTYDASTSGQYATAEGMFTHAAGTCSHAEGGGELDETWHDAGLDGDRILHFGSNDRLNVALVGNGTDPQYATINASRFNGVLADVDGHNFDGNSYTRDKSIKSIYIAALLRNTTSGDILKKSIGCIGPDVTNKSNYIGDISHVDEYSDGCFPYITSGLTMNKIDIGRFKPQYDVGFGVDEVPSGGMSYDIGSSSNLSGTGSETLGNLTWKQVTVCLDTSGLSSKKSSYILYKGNVCGKSTSDPININISEIIPSLYDGFIKVEANITINMDRYINQTTASQLNMPVGYAYSTGSGDSITYSWTYTKSDDSVVPNYILPLQIFFGRDLYTDEELAPHAGGGVPYWYMDGDTPSNSNILIPGLPGCAFATYSGTKSNVTYTNAPGIDFKFGEGLDADVRPAIIGRNVSDSYSLEFYYSYSEVNDGREYPIEWIPAGYSKQGIGLPSRALGDYSHAEGCGTKAKGDYSHAEGYVDQEEYTSESENYPGAYGPYSHVEGINCITKSAASHAEGSNTAVYGGYGHAEGYRCEVQDDSAAYSYGAHAEGRNSIAKGGGAHAEGVYSKALAKDSHAGAGGTASLIGQFIHGIFGFGGIAEDITDSITYERSDNHLDGCLLQVTAYKSVTFKTNAILSGYESEYYPKVLFIVVADTSGNIEVDCLRILIGTAGAPTKTQIVRDGVSSTNAWPTITTSTTGSGTSAEGTITIPGWSNRKFVQVIRVM